MAPTRHNGNNPSRDTPNVPASRVWSGFRSFNPLNSNPIQALRDFFTVKHSHGLDPETSERLTLLQQTIAGASAGLKTTTGALKGLLDVNIPTSIQGILLTMLRAVPYILTDDPRMTAVLAAIYAAEGGPMYSAAIFGMAWLVKQIIKRSTPSVEPQADETDPAVKEEEQTAISAFYSLIHYYTVGWLPENTKDFIKALAGANVAFAFVKNIDAFGSFIMRLLKFSVNYVWYVATGTYFFDASQLECTDTFHAIADDVRVAEKNATLSGARLKVLIDRLDALVLKATDCDAPRDFIANVVAYTAALKSRAMHLAPEHAMAHKKPPAVGIQVLGLAGTGKTSMLMTMVQALARLHGHTDPVEDLMWFYQPGANFQAPAQKKPFAAIFDDISLIDDPEARKAALNFLTRLSNDTPVLIDQPFIKNLDYASFSYFIVTGNLVDNRDISNDKAYFRRINGGLWVVTLNKEFADNNGTFDEGRMFAANASPNDVWTFHSPGVDDANLSQVVSIAHSVAIRTAEVHAKRRNVPNLTYTDFKVPQFDFIDMNAAAINSFVGKYGSKVKGKEREAASSQPILTPSIFSATLEEEPALGSVVPIHEPFHTPPNDSSDDEPVNPDLTSAIDKLLRVAKQGFVGKAVPDYIQAAITDPTTAATITNYVQRSNSTFTVKDGRLMDGNKIFDLAKIASKYVPPAPVKKIAEVAIPLDQWTSANFFAARSCTFSISETDGAYDAYSYAHKGIALTSAHGPGSTEVNFNQFCIWALAHPELLGNNLMVFAMERDRPIETWKTKYPYLHIALVALVSSAVGMLISVALSQVLVYVSQQAYSVKSIVKNPRSALAPSKQGFTGSLSIDGIMAKFARNTLPATTLSGTRTTSFYVAGMCSNLARTTKHCLDGATHIALGGVVGAVFPLKFYERPEDVPKVITHFVAVVPEAGADGAWLVFPKTTPFFADVTPFLCHSDQDVNQLTGCGLVSVPHDLEFLDENDLPASRWGAKVKNSPVTKGDFLPLGNADVAANYDDGENDGLFIDSPVPTRAGFCGLVCLSSNTQVGRGVRISPGLHAGYLESHKKAVSLPNTIEMVDDFRLRCPGVTHVRPEGLIEFMLPIDSERDSWVGPFANPIAQVPNSDASYVSTRNTIIQSPIAGATHGMPYDDVTGAGISVVPTPNIAPAKMRDVAGAFSKVKYNYIPSNELHIAAHYEAAERVYYNVVNAAPEYFKPADDLFTVEQALNGIPEWGVPSLDLNKARGVFPGCQLKNRRDLVDRVGDDLVPKPFFKARVLAIVESIKQGVLPTPWVSGNLKAELRDPSKVARTTRTYPFETLVALRCFSMHIFPAYHHGRIRNRALIGADLTGGDGYMLHKRAVTSHAAGKVLNDGDARAFDSSENIVVAGAIEAIHARMIRDRHPFLPEAACDAAAMTVRWANVIVGNKVYSQWNSVLSGSLYTTDHNTATISALVIGAAILADISPDVYHQAYGDDFNIEDTPDNALIEAIASHSAALGITLTPSRKDQTVFTPSTPESLVRLKRTCYERSGVTYAPLDVGVLAHIGDWIDAKDRPDLAVPVVAESALREWFHHGRKNFENAKIRINAALRLNGFREIPITYNQLYVDHLKRGPYAYSSVEKQSKVTDSKAAANPVTVKSHDTLLNTQTSTLSAQGAGTVTTPLSGTTTQHKLTQYRDDAGLSSSVMTPYVRTQLPNPLNPNPPMGIEGIIVREYPVAEFVWNTTDAALTAKDVLHFPRLLYNNPTIKEKLSSAKFFRTGVEITARVNGQMSCAGKVGFALMRGGAQAADPRLTDPHALLNMPQWTLSASTSIPVSFQIPWCGELMYDDLPAATADTACGSVIPYIINPLVWVTPTPPSGLTVTIYARFIAPTVSGFDIQGGPPAKPLKLKEVTRSAQVRSAVTKQSTSDEGFSKSVQNVVDGVTSAVDTVKTVINVAKTVAEIGALDKPISVQAAQPSRIDTGADFTHANGMSFSTTLALSQDVLASITDRYVGEESPKPSWDQLLGTPGFVDWVVINTSDPAGTLIKEWAVDPATMYSLAGEGGSSPWMPTPLAYWATTHSLWRGSIKYLISLSCPVLEKCTVRITYLPTSIPAGVALSPDVVGDAPSIVVEVCGDKDIPFVVHYDRPTPYLRTRVNAPVSETNCNGRIVMQLVTPLSGPAAVNVPAVRGTIYMAAEKGFQLVGYGRTPLKPTWNPDAARKIKVTSKVTKQSCIQDIFGLPFAPLAPSTMKNTTGFVSNDTSSGVCDVLRRPHCNAALAVDTSGIDIPGLLPIIPLGTGPFAYHFLPFQGWSGSLNIHMVPAAANLGGLFTLTRMQGDVSAMAESGQVFWQTSLNPVKSVTIPWVEPFIYFPFYDTTTTRITPQPYVDMWDSVAEGYLYYYHSAADDLCLYHFVVCPFLTD